MASKPVRSGSIGFSDGSQKGSAAYWTGYHDGSCNWQLTSGTFADFTPTGTAILYPRSFSGITDVTTAAGNLPGITFTPESVDAVYEITAVCAMYIQGPVGGNDAATMRMVGGATEKEITTNSSAYKPAGVVALLGPTAMTGIFEPKTTSPVTVKIQGLIGGDPTYLLQLGYINNFIEWTVTRIR